MYTIVNTYSHSCTVWAAGNKTTMENEIQNPGIYIHEISLLPKSVVQVETAIPAFIGYTEKAIFKGMDLHSKDTFQPLEINSFAEFEHVFGCAPEPSFVEFELDGENSIVSTRTEELSFLYYSVKLFFDNGGITCLIVSVGSYTAAAGKVSKQKLLKGLACLEKTDAPTLLVIPDAAKLTYAEAGELHAAMLHQSGKLKNRFGLLDLVNGNVNLSGAENPVNSFRQNLDIKLLSYGAAYYPWLVTSWNRNAGSNIILSAKYFKNGTEVKDLSTLFKQNTVNALQKSVLFAQREMQLKQPDLHLMTRTEKAPLIAVELYNYLRDFFKLVSHEAASNEYDPFSALHRNYVSKGSAFHTVLKSLMVLAKGNHLPLQTGSFITDFSPLTFSVLPAFIKKRSKGRKNLSSGNLKFLVTQAEQLVSNFFNEVKDLQLSLQELLKQHDKMYESAVNAIEARKVVVPPGGAVAGIISQVDRQRGVWKAPANVSLASVVRPAVDVLHHDQSTLNVDVIEGKSVNAIRFIAGKGVTIWGARTLAGNDNEWRYINVRRFCIMVEASVIEAIRPFSFEPNNEVTWGRVRILIDNFFNSLWRAGALQGSKPEEAYFVKLGLEDTMSASDIENGMMKLVTGLAVIKPAEFIILSVSQKTSGS